jgi:hypothetical protein
MIKIFSSTSTQDLEETVNDFLCNPRYHIEDIQYRPTVLSTKVYDATVYHVMVIYHVLDY